MANQKAKKFSELARNRKNPFGDQALIRIGENLLIKKVNATKQDESTVLVGVDPKTGEALGQTTFWRNKVVDTETFAKIFSDGFKNFAGLKASTMTLFSYITSSLLKPNKDEFFLFIDDAVKETELSQRSIYRALTELADKEIIARGRIDEQFYINPVYVFNGDRVTFCTTYITKNYPDYSTGTHGLKKTITRMQSENILPHEEIKRPKPEFYDPRDGITPPQLENS